MFGDTNIWYAGSGGGCPLPTYRHGKAPSMSITVRPGQVLTFTATGSVQTDPTAPFNGPDGGHGGVGYTGSNLAAENGLSGVYVNATGFLGGAFVGPGGAGSQYANGMFFTSLAPQLNQVFYVGNGEAANVYQQFTVPSGATRLVLGIPDGLNGKGCPGFYSDNRGWFNVTVVRIA